MSSELFSRVCVVSSIFTQCSFTVYVHSVCNSNLLWYSSICVGFKLLRYFVHLYNSCILVIYVLYLSILFC